MNILDNEMVVYCYTNKINDKKYIGITKNKLAKRHREHLYDSKNNRDNCPFHNAIRKYGIENFELEILRICKTEKELKESEMYFINKYNTFIHYENSKGYNATLGGDGIYGLSGENNPLYGTHLSEERKDQNRKIMKELYDKGKHPFNKMSFKKEDNPFYGKHHTNETKQKIGDANRGSNSGKYGTGQKVICVNTGEIFISIHDAFLKTGISKGSISECCKGKRKSAGKLNGEKLYWKFID